MEEIFKENKPKVENHEKELKQQEIRFVGELKNPMNGHVLWSYNLKSGELLEIEPIRSIAVNAMTMQPIYDAKLEIKPNHYYFYKLNQENAIKHLLKEGLVKSNKVLKK